MTDNVLANVAIDGRDRTGVERLTATGPGTRTRSPPPDPGHRVSLASSLDSFERPS